MPVNIEIKARARDFALQRALAAQVSGGSPALLAQEDTFFNAPSGRLKLRELPGRAELIFYQRPDQAGPKHCDYIVVPVEHPKPLKEALKRALGVRGIVKKQRWLYLAGQTRIHLDEVEGLGSFIELEVVMRPGQTDADGQRIAAGIMEQLEIRQDDLIEGAYLDLLEK